MWNRPNEMKIKQTKIKHNDDALKLNDFRFEFDKVEERTMKNIETEPSIQ